MNRIDRNVVEPLVAASLLYLIMGPYFAWSIIGNKLLYYFVCGIVSLLFIKNFNIKGNRGLFSYIVLLVVFYSLLTGLNVFGFIAIALSVFLPFGKDDFSHRVFKNLINIYVVLIFISSIVWIFVLLGMIQPIGTLQPLNELKTIDYSVFPFVLRSNGDSFFRFCGLFDEPGVVGTFNVIFLFILGFNKKDWKTYVLLISGALSLSLFFFVSVIGYFLVRSIMKLDFKVLLICAFSLLLFYNLTKDDDFFSLMLWDRIEYDESEGRFSGDNRVHDDADALYKKKMYTHDYWFGTSNPKDLEYFEGGSSYKAVVLSCGMICFFFYVLFFILLAYNKMDKERFILYLLLLFMTFYQRPWMFGMGYLFLFPYYARCSRLLKDNNL